MIRVGEGGWKKGEKEKEELTRFCHSNWRVVKLACNVFLETRDSQKSAEFESDFLSQVPTETPLHLHLIVSSLSLCCSLPSQTGLSWLQEF